MASSLTDPQARPRYLTAEAARRIAGMGDRRTLIKDVKPVAWYATAKGDKLMPLFDLADIEAFVAQREQARAATA